jgi:1-deoxyxylulose-5-phosphate synthase
LEGALQYRKLGSSDLLVSRIALGTAELGLDYGFRGSAHYLHPDRDDAFRIILRAVELGINFIDTARAYGLSEEVVGCALKRISEQPFLCTKVAIPPPPTLHNSVSVRRHIVESVQGSLKALQIDTIDLLLIHNTSLEILCSTEAMSCLEELQHAGKFRFLGASCYDEEVALAALDHDQVRALQVPYNLLDRAMARKVFRRAVERNVGVLTRSAFLRGVLTAEVDSVPAKLAALKQTALALFEASRNDVDDLGELALRYCLSDEEITSIVIGVRSVQELESDVKAYNKGRLPAERVERVQETTVVDPTLLDTRTWGDLI